MVRLSTETASPFVVITAIRPVVAPIEESSVAGMEIVVESPELLEIVLFLQNFTVIVPVNPVPVIISVPPPVREIVVVEIPVIDGG